MTDLHPHHAAQELLEPEQRLTLEFFCVQHRQPHSHLCSGRFGLAHFGGVMIKMPDSGTCFCSNECPAFKALVDRNGHAVQ